MASPEVQSPRPLRERSPPNEAPSPRHDDGDHNRDRDRDDERNRPRGRDRELDRKRRRDDKDRDRDRDRGGDRYRPAGSAARDRSPPPRQRQERVIEKPPERTEEEKQAMLKAEYQKLMDMRSGGTYIPPARLRALQAQIQQDTSAEGARLKQKLHWEALKKSITGIINKVNLGNIKSLVPELFEENLVRGRGAFCRAIMRAQASSLSFTPIYAALTAVVNSKIPLVGELLAKRLVVQFRKSFRRDDKKVCLAATTFIAHLVNFQVIHENLALQMLQLLLHKPTDDSVEIAVGFMKEIGEFLTDMKPMAARVVFDKFRDVLHEGDIDKRVQYAVEVLFQVRKDNFKDNPAIREELDLLEEDDMITHYVELDGELDTEDMLNIFKFDADFEKSEEAYIQLKREILGLASDDEEDDEDDDDESSEDEEDEEQKAIEIKDQSNADLVNLRRTIYLTIQSAISPEEAVHKLMKVVLPPGQEPELPSMVVECCSQATTYQKFYGLIGERFAKLNRLWNELFEEQFRTTYDTIHRYETNRLRNVARFFGHLFASDAIGWHSMSTIVMTEDATTSSSRIFVKILLQEISEELGMTKLAERMKDPLLQPSLEGLFPHDQPRNIRFSINYFTSIGMGDLTEEMREFLQNMPKPTLPAPPRDGSDLESVSSYTSYTGSSYSSRSRSRTPARKRRDSFRSDSRGRSVSRDRRSSRSRSYSRSVSPRRGRGSRHSSYDSRSPSPKRSRRYSDAGTNSRSRSRTPPLRARRQTSSISRSPSPDPRRSRRDSYSASPSPRRGGGGGGGGARRRYNSLSPSRTPSRSPVRGRPTSYDSRSPSPARGGRQARRRGSPSPPPPAADSRVKGQGRDVSYSRSPSRSVSPSRSRSPVNVKRRRRSSSSRSRSPAPPPTKRGRRSD